MTRSVRGEESDEGFDPLWGDLDEEEAFEEFLDLVAYEQVIAEGGRTLRGMLCRRNSASADARQVRCQSG